MDAIPFVKMHGCGNDYLYVDCWQRPLPVAPETLAPLISDRHRGVGADGLILLLPPSGSDHHATMRMFNADGSESEMCGNGLRCLAFLAHRLQRVPETAFTVATGAGLLDVQINAVQDLIATVSVDMGPPRLQAAAVPVELDAAGPTLQLRLSTPGHPAYDAIAVGMGNPHAVIFVPQVADIPLATIGPLLEHHPCFPRRANIEFVEVLEDTAKPNVPPRLRQRTWERGSGITLACGTGACAVTVAAILDQRIAGRQAEVVLDGGSLWVSWPDDEAHVHLRGEAVWVCSGQWPLR